MRGCRKGAPTSATSPPDSSTSAAEPAPVIDGDSTRVDTTAAAVEAADPEAGSSDLTLSDSYSTAMAPLAPVEQALAAGEAAGGAAYTAARATVSAQEAASSQDFASRTAGTGVPPAIVARVMGMVMRAAAAGAPPYLPTAPAADTVAAQPPGWFRLLAAPQRFGHHLSRVCPWRPTWSGS